MPKKPTITSKRDAYQALGNMKVFYEMLNQEYQDLIGMLDILNSDDPHICFFLESSHQEIVMQGSSENVLKVRYMLDEELCEGKVTFGTIELFMNMISDNIENEVLKSPSG